jgi:hypothetical protein
MPNSTLPPDNEKAHEIARRIANERPLKKDRTAPDAYVTGGFNQAGRREPPDQAAAPPAGWPASREG